MRPPRAIRRWGTISAASPLIPGIYSPLMAKYCTVGLEMAMVGRGRDGDCTEGWRSHCRSPALLRLLSPKIGAANRPKPVSPQGQHAPQGSLPTRLLSASAASQTACPLPMP